VSVDLAALTAPLHDALVADRRHLHRHPELSFAEHATADWVVRRLREVGVPEVRRVADTGVLAVLRGERPGPVVALRADLDALPVPDEKTVPYRSTVPGVSHACGHDGHVAMLIGVAAVLAGNPDLVRGEVRLLFQPAEEKPPGGARALLDAGVLRGVDAIYGAHLWSELPAGQVGVHTGPTMAAGDGFTVRIDGRGGHAGLPHQSVDALVVAAKAVLDLQLLVSRYVDPLHAAVVNIGKLTAGTRFNVIADRADFEGTVRTFDDGVRTMVRERFAELLEACCAGTGARHELSYRAGYPALVNHAAGADVVRAAVRELPGVRLVEMRPTMAGEDFSYYLRELPGAFYFVGAAPASGELYPNHHPRFDIDEDALAVGVRVMLATYLRHLAQG
jgi:amidohydrolase